MKPLLNKIQIVFHYLSKYPKIGKFIGSILGFIEVPILELFYFIDKNLQPGSYKHLMKTFSMFYKSKVIPVSTRITVEPYFSPTEELLELLKRVEAISLGYCYCRTKYQNCNNPIWTCIHIGTAKHLRELGKKIPLKSARYEEAEELLLQADELGLIHQLLTAPTPDFVYVICNCCPCCCVMLKNTIDYNQRGLILKSEFTISGPNDNCSNCGKCIERCYFNAIIQMKEKIMIHPDKCSGCGLCVNSCPNEALKLIKKTNH